MAEGPLGDDDIVKACAGDRDAWRRLTDDLDPYLKGLAHHRVPEHAVEDAVQETLLRLHLELERYDPSRGSLRTWAGRFLLNFVVGEHRRESALKRNARAAGFDTVNTSEAHDEDGYDLPVDPRAADPADQVVDNDEIHRALASLSPEDRHVLGRRVIGFSYDDIAPSFGISPATLRKKVERARSTMRAAVDQDDDGDRERRSGV